MKQHLQIRSYKLYPFSLTRMTTSRFDHVRFLDENEPINFIYFNICLSLKYSYFVKVLRDPQDWFSSQQSYEGSTSQFEGY